MDEKSKQWLQYLATVSSSFSAVSTGFHFGWTSPAIPKLLNNELAFKVTSQEISYIVMIGPFGYLISAVFIAYVIDKIGRKSSLLILALLQILAWVLIANASNIIPLYISRVVAGAAEGAIFTVLPMYICEIAEPQIRGILGSFFTLGLILGLLIINCYASYTSIEVGAYISIIVPVAFIITFIWMPETPYYFIMKNQVDDARKSLNCLLQKSNVEKELSLLTSSIQRQLSEDGGFLEICDCQNNCRAFIIMLGLRILQQYSGYYSFCYYTQFLFKQSDASIDPVINAMLYTLSHFIFTIFASLLVDRVGRKFLLLSSVTGTALVLFGEGTYFLFYQTNSDSVKVVKWIPLTGMILYSFFFNLGLGIIPNLLTGELFSLRIKSKALAAVIIFCAFGISSSTKLFNWSINLLGISAPFYIFGCICTLGIFFCYYFVPETRGKSLEEIQQDLRAMSLD